MSSPALRLPAGPRRCARGVSLRAVPGVDLEWFWPSRRCHAYDELCRR